MWSGVVWCWVGYTDVKPAGGLASLSPAISTKRQAGEGRARGSLSLLLVQLVERAVNAGGALRVQGFQHLA